MISLEQAFFVMMLDVENVVFFTYLDKTSYAMILDVESAVVLIHSEIRLRLLRFLRIVNQSAIATMVSYISVTILHVLDKLMERSVFHLEIRQILMVYPIP